MLVFATAALLVFVTFTEGNNETIPATRLSATSVRAWALEGLVVVPSEEWGTSRLATCLRNRWCRPPCSTLAGATVTPSWPACRAVGGLYVHRLRNGIYKSFACPRAAEKCCMPRWRYTCQELGGQCVNACPIFHGQPIKYGRCPRGGTCCALRSTTDEAALKSSNAVSPFQSCFRAGGVCRPWGTCPESSKLRGWCFFRTCCIPDRPRVIGSRSKVLSEVGNPSTALVKYDRQGGAIELGAGACSINPACWGAVAACAANPLCVLAVAGGLAITTVGAIALSNYLSAPSMPVATSTTTTTTTTSQQPRCPHWRFERDHLCPTCFTEEAALAFSLSRPRIPIINHVFLGSRLALAPWITGPLGLCINSKPTVAFKCFLLKNGTQDPLPRQYCVKISVNCIFRHDPLCAGHCFHELLRDTCI